MKKVKYVEGRLRDTLLRRINEALEKDPTAKLVSVVERNKLYTAFIQYNKF